MPIAYELEIKDDHIHVTARGELQSVDEVTDYLHPLMDELVTLDAHTVLLDHRLITGDVEKVRSFNFADTLSQYFDKLSVLRIAVVSSQERFQYMKFIEAIAQNRGLMLLAFDSMSDAHQWLGD